MRLFFDAGGQRGASWTTRDTSTWRFAIRGL